MSLALSSTAFDAYLQVIRNGSVFAFNDDINGTTNSLINYTYQTGDKIYASSSDGGLVTGAYSLKLTGTTIPAFEVLTTLEDTPITLTTTMLPITDLEQRPDQLTYTLATLPLKGILSKAGINLSAGGTFTQADVDKGLILLTPKANANGTDNFTFSVADGLGGVLANQTFAINITSVNDAPTLTAFAAAVASGTEDNPISVTFASLKTRGNEVDVDGTVTAFVVKGVSTGSLKIGASADTATTWSAGSNDVIDTTHLGYWTPAANANGMLNAFTAVAKDNGGLESITPVLATISVAAVPDVTVIVGITPVEGGAAGTFKINLDSPAPIGGLTINYSLSGSATLNTDYTVAAGTNITAASAGSFTIAEGETTAKLMINAGNDGIADPNETIKLSLMTGSGYQFSYAASFDPKVDFATGSNPGSVSVGDFNGDGKLDLAVVNMYDNTVSVLLRNAANTDFYPEGDFATGSNPVSVSAGDFNGDGKLDLAVANYYSGTVSGFLRNAANTGFDPAVDYTTGSSPQSVSVGDFNGDGKTDLAVANVDSNTVSVLFRNADNTGFDPKIDIATGQYPNSVSVGDFNGDGKTDLAVANWYDNTVSVLFRNAANTGFAPKENFASGLGPSSVSVGDFNGDGKLDLAVTNAGNNTVSVLLRNDSNTGFNPKVDFAISNWPQSVSVGDFNGDGKADIVVPNGYNKSVSVLLRNDSNTGFNPKVDFATGLAPSSVSVGDFNGDGKIDLAVANQSSGTVSVLLNSTVLPATLTITDHTPPTLTAFVAPVATSNEDNQIAITFASLKTQGNEADVDGTVTAFVIKAVSSGSLKIGTSALAATAWNASTNNTVDATHSAYWTPAANAYGTLNAFTAVAKDNGGLLSVTPVQAKINVVPVRDDLIINGTIGNDTLTGDAIDSGSYDTLNGLAGNDVLNGLLGNDSLNGGGGSDTMTGGDGSDIYYVDNIGDVVTETNVLAITGGTDLVYSYLSAYTLEANVENGRILLTTAANMTGNTLDNVIYAGSGVNNIDGLGGSDTLSYQYATTSGLSGVTLNLSVLNGSGQSTASGISGADLIKGIENIIGSNYNDTLTGNAGNNVLNGLLGADMLTGGLGNDTYYIDNIGDVVTETSTLLTEIDIVYSAVTYTLGANIENLVLIGAVAINGTGNALNNTLTGNAAANILSGLAGNDSLNGGLGTDKLIGGKGQDNLTGGAGRDTFTFAAGDDGITAATLDKILDYAKGVVGTGDLIDYSANLTKGGNASAATVSQASINQSTGIATFASGSGTTLTDALNDITARFTAATNTAGEFACFKINNTGNYYLFVSDGTPGAGVNDDLIQLVGVTSIGTIDLTGGNLTITS